MLILIHQIFYIDNFNYTDLSSFIKMTKDRSASSETFLHKYGISWSKEYFYMWFPPLEMNYLVKAYCLMLTNQEIEVEIYYLKL